MSKPEARSPLASGMTSGRQGAGAGEPVRIAERRVAIAQLAAFKGRAGDLANRVSAGLGVTLPGPGKSGHGDGVTAVWIGPETWLVTAPDMGGDGLIARVQAAAGDAAAVTDQSHGKTALRLTGARVRDALDKVCRLDLHPKACKPGDAAVTMIAHVTACLVMVDEAPTYDIIGPSTFALSLLEGLEMAAEEFGYELEAATA